MITVQYDFDSPGSFTFDAAKIGFSGGKAVLNLIPFPAQAYDQDFSSATGFTYDAAKAEFVAGAVQQKDQTPAGSLLGATYTTTRNASWFKSGGNVTATLLGTPGLTGGELICATNASTGVYYQDALIGALGTVGTIRVKYKPSYTGAPPQNTNIFSLVNPSNNNDRILLTHSPSGNTVRVTVSNNVGTAVHTAVAIGAAWNPTAGQIYEIEMGWNSVSGGIYLFINGVLHGNLATTWTRGTSATRFNVGATANTYNICNADYADALVFTTLQHTTTYTPSVVPVPETIYAATNVILPDFVYAGIGTIVSIDAFATSQSGTPRFISNGYWYDGADWVVSNGTYAQANTVATVIANIATLDVDGELDFTFTVAFTNSNTISLVSNLSGTYSGQIYPTDNPSIKPSTPLTIDQVTQLVLTAAAAGSDGVAMQTQVGSTLYYFDGADWLVATAGDFAQTNDVATIFANIDALPGIEGGIYYTPVILLHSDDGTTTPDLTSLIVTYSAHGEAPTIPNHCNVFGYIIDEMGFPVVNATVTATLLATRLDQGYTIAESVFTYKTKADGYFEFDLLETETANKQMSFSIAFPAVGSTAGKKYSYGKTVIPDQPTANIVDLAFVA